MSKNSNKPGARNIAGKKRRAGKSEPTAASHWRYRGGLLAAVIVAVCGIAAGVLLAGAGASTQESRGVQLQVVHKNYDWGVTKPGGHTEEDLHQAFLDFHFEAYDKGDAYEIRFGRSLDLAFYTGNDTDKVEYRVESVRYKFVERPRRCHNTKHTAAIRPRFFAPSKNFVLESNWPSAWLGSSVEIDSSHFTALAPSADKPYFCLAVKLKGAIETSPDTHPEFFFTLPPWSWPAEVL